MPKIDDNWPTGIMKKINSYEETIAKLYDKTAIDSPQKVVNSLVVLLLENRKWYRSAGKYGIGDDHARGQAWIIQNIISAVKLELEIRQLKTLESIEKRIDQIAERQK